MTPKALEGVQWRWKNLLFSDRRAIVALAGLPDGTARRDWEEFPPAELRKLVSAFKRAIELGTDCAIALGCDE